MLGGDQSHEKRMPLPGSIIRYKYNNHMYMQIIAILPDGQYRYAFFDSTIMHPHSFIDTLDVLINYGQIE